MNRAFAIGKQVSYLLDLRGAGAPLGQHVWGDRDAGLYKELKRRTPSSAGTIQRMTAELPARYFFGGPGGGR